MSNDDGSCQSTFKPKKTKIFEMVVAMEQFPVAYPKLVAMPHKRLTAC